MTPNERHAHFQYMNAKKAIAAFINATEEVDGMEDLHKEGKFTPHDFTLERVGKKWKLHIPEDVCPWDHDGGLTMTAKSLWELIAKFTFVDWEHPDTDDDEQWAAAMPTRT